MPLPSIGLGAASIGKLSIAALVSGAAVAAPIGASALAEPSHQQSNSPVSQHENVKTQPFSSVEKDSSIAAHRETAVNAAKPAAAVTLPSLLGTNVSKDSIYDNFADNMNASPLSNSDTDAVFNEFKDNLADKIADWEKNGVPADSDVVSQNLNAGVPSFTPKYMPVVTTNGNYIQVNVNDDQERQLRENIIRTAASKYGLPYIWGGNDPNVGLDCSGYAKWVYAQNGIVIPRVVATIRPVIKPISEADAKPGDLVFVNGTEHIGIVLDAAKHTYWNSPHPGSYVQIGNYSWGNNISFGTVINNTEHPVSGVPTSTILNAVGNGDATSTVQVGDKNNPTLPTDLTKKNPVTTKPKTPAAPKSTSQSSKPAPSKSSSPTPKPSSSSTPSSSSSSSSSPTSSSSSSSSTPSSSSSISSGSPTSTASSSSSTPSSTAAPSAESTSAAAEPTAKATSSGN